MNNDIMNKDSIVPFSFKINELREKPLRKKPIMDFQEGLITGMLLQNIVSIKQGLKRPLSYMVLYEFGRINAKSEIKELVTKYSYSAEDIKDILEACNVKNVNWIFEYIMTDGNPNERTCTYEGCPVIMINQLLIDGTECGRHNKDDT